MTTNTILIPGPDNPPYYNMLLTRDDGDKNLKLINMAPIWGEGDDPDPENFTVELYSQDYDGEKALTAMERTLWYALECLFDEATKPSTNR